MRVTNTPTLRQTPQWSLRSTAVWVWDNPWESAERAATSVTAALGTCGVFVQHATAGDIVDQEKKASELKLTELKNLEEACMKKTRDYMDRSLDRFDRVGKEKAEQEIVRFFSNQTVSMKNKIDRAFECSVGHHKHSSSILGCLSTTPISGKRAIIQHEYAGRDANYHTDMEHQIKMIQTKVAELLMREERYKPYADAFKDLANVDWDVKYVQDERRASEPNPPSIEEMASRTPIEPPAVVEPLIKRATSAPKETLNRHIDQLNQQQRVAVYNRGVNKAAGKSGTAPSAFEETFSFEKVLLVYINTLEVFVFTVIKKLTFHLMLSLICCKVAAMAKLFICVSLIVCLKNAIFLRQENCHLTQWETCKTLYTRGRIIFAVCSVVCIKFM